MKWYLTLLDKTKEMSYHIRLNSHLTVNYWMLQVHLLCVLTVECCYLQNWEALRGMNLEAEEAISRKRWSEAWLWTNDHARHALRSEVETLIWLNLAISPLVFLRKGRWGDQVVFCGNLSRRFRQARKMGSGSCFLLGSDGYVLALTSSQETSSKETHHCTCNNQMLNLSLIFLNNWSTDQTSSHENPKSNSFWSQKLPHVYDGTNGSYHTLPSSNNLHPYPAILDVAGFIFILKSTMPASIWLNDEFHFQNLAKVQTCMYGILEKPWRFFRRDLF